MGPGGVPQSRRRGSSQPGLRRPCGPSRRQAGDTPVHRRRCRAASQLERARDGRGCPRASCMRTTTRWCSRTRGLCSLLTARCRWWAADIRDPEAALASPGLRGLLDLGQPFCVLLASVLHFLPADEADAAVAAFRRLMIPGSYLVISAGTSTGTDPGLISRLQAAYDDTTPVTGRTAEEVSAWSHLGQTRPHRRLGLAPRRPAAPARSRAFESQIPGRRRPQISWHGL
jgi:hypothetical protein